jgi:mannose-6-phosphate isomerase-like protein (cupin superfamily)
MKEIPIISSGANFTAIGLGELDQLMDHSYIHPKLKQEVKGKVFIGEILKTTGVEISFQLLPPDTPIPFLHKHKAHEEVYIILKGFGQFQVDGQCFDVQEGSVIRIDPEGERTLRNNSNDPMVFMVIQSMAGSLDQHLIFDGYRVKGEITWDKGFDKF